MNKKLIVLVLILVLLASTFAFASCQNQLQIDIEKSVVGLDVTEKIVPGKETSQNKHYWVIKYYVDPAEFDLSTANSIKIKTWMPTYKGGKLSSYQKTFTGTIPEDVAPTADKNYFVIELDKSKYNPTAEREWSHEIADYLPNFYLDGDGVKHFYYYQDFETIINCYVYINDSGDASDDNPMDNITKIPSIGMTILIGVAMVLIGVGLFWVALVLIGNKLSLAIAFLIPLVMTIGSWIIWGWVRGLIMTIFFAIYYIAIAVVGKHLDEVARRYS